MPAPLSAALRDRIVHALVSERPTVLAKRYNVSPRSIFRIRKHPTSTVLPSRDPTATDERSTSPTRTCPSFSPCSSRTSRCSMPPWQSASLRLPDGTLPARPHRTSNDGRSRTKNDGDRLVFVDEMGFMQGMRLSRGYAPRGHRCVENAPFRAGRRLNVIGNMAGGRVRSLPVETSVGAVMLWPPLTNGEGATPHSQCRVGGDDRAGGCTGRDVAAVQFGTQRA